MLQRILDLTENTNKKSIFLLGPRQTGKSTLLRQIKGSVFIDLLDPATYRTLSAKPESLEERILFSHSGQNEIIRVVIDEIQLLSELLNMVHLLIEKYPTWRFILTGSSVRKLRQKGVNLLGGRAHKYSLHPVVSQELELSTQTHFDWKSLLRYGGLPSMIGSSDWQMDQSSYVGLYLQEEIQSEAAIRSTQHFSRFLNLAGHLTGKQINFQNVSSDVGVSAKVLKSYFEILDDTLVGELLPSLQGSTKRKAVAMPKFYFFDVGVANFLKGVFSATPGTDTFGDCLEHFIYCELRAHISYRKIQGNLCYWRTTSQLEVDFVFTFNNEYIAIEVKGTENPDKNDMKGLRAFKDDYPQARLVLVCAQKHSGKTQDGIDMLSVEDFLKLLWNGSLFSKIAS